VPVPHSENHGGKIGDTKIGVQTQSSEKLSPAVGIVLVAGGVLAFGPRESQDLAALYEIGIGRTLQRSNLWIRPQHLR
jgi:hypothetical protein